MSDRSENPMLALGRRPDLAWLPIDKLVVDMRYQRGIDSLRSRRLIDRISWAFSWAAFGAVLATPTGRGDYAVIDGQHRVEGARGRGGIEVVPVILLDELTVADQAALFVATNRDRVAVNPLALYHARVAAEDAEALKVKALCDEAGISLPRSNMQHSRLKPGQTTAIRSIFLCLERHGESATGAALAVLGEAYRDKGGMLRASTIRGLAMFLAADPERLGERWRRRLVALFRASDIGAEADSMAAVSGTWATRMVGRVILDAVAGEELADPEPEPEPPAGAPARADVRPEAGPDAVPEPLPEPRTEIIEDLAAIEARYMLPQPVQRRCEACQQLFTSTRVAETKCPSCTAALAGKDGGRGAGTPRAAGRGPA